MSTQWNSDRGAGAPRPAATKWPWAPWVVVGGAVLSLLSMLIPWVSMKSPADKTAYFNKLGGPGYVKAFGAKVKDGGWAAHAWLTLLVLLAIIIVAMLVLHSAAPALRYAVAGLAVIQLALMIWGLVAAGKLADSLNDTYSYGTHKSDDAGMAAGGWLFLVSTLVVIAGAVLLLLPLFTKPGGAPQQMYGQPQQGQWGQPQHPQQGWGQQPQAPQQPGWGQAPQQGQNQPPQGW